MVIRFIATKYNNGKCCYYMLILLIYKFINLLLAVRRFWKGLDDVPELYGTTFLITVGVIGVIYKAATEPEGGKMVRYKDRYMSESIMI